MIAEYFGGSGDCAPDPKALIRPLFRPRQVIIERAAQL
jgi:hypothetical protein